MGGIWDPESDLKKPRQRLEAAGAGHVVVSFADCVDSLEALAMPAVATRRATNASNRPVLQA